MRPIGLDHVLGRERYAQAREAIRRRVIEHKRTRRVAVGDRLSFVFEDRATVWYQTQEMLWVEHVTDLDAIRDELDVYNALLPSETELAATLLIELADPAQMREEFQRLLGLDRHVTLLVGDRRIAAVFEGGRQTEDRISAVQYVRFPCDVDARRDLADGATLALTVEHPSYAATTIFDAGTRASIVASFLDERAADAALGRVRDGV